MRISVRDNDNSQKLSYKNKRCRLIKIKRKNTGNISLRHCPFKPFCVYNRCMRGVVSWVTTLVWSCYQSVWLESTSGAEQSITQYTTVKYSATSVTLFKGTVQQDLWPPVFFPSFIHTWATGLKYFRFWLRICWVIWIPRQVHTFFLLVLDSEYTSELQQHA